jgi:hypothetical protein
MEYVIRANRTFEEIEAQTIDALERHGFGVQRTFSLRSATRSGAGLTSGDPAYTVLMLYSSAPPGRPLGLVLLYQRAGCTVLRSMLASSAVPHAEALSEGDDVGADLVAALVGGGLDFCVDAAVHDAAVHDGVESSNCIDAKRAVEEEEPPASGRESRRVEI